jgi:hypothetical protein
VRSKVQPCCHAFMNDALSGPGADRVCRRWAQGSRVRQRAVTTTDLARHWRADDDSAVECVKCAQPFWARAADGGPVLCSVCGAGQLWLGLPHQVRDEIDVLLRGRKELHAIRLLAEHALGVKDAQDVVAARGAELARPNAIESEAEATAWSPAELLRRITGRTM